MTSLLPSATKTERIGLKQGRQIAHLSQAERFAFLAEGLPLIVRSAFDYWRAAERLEGQLREAEIVCRNAEEEAAKALILIDLVRCPPKRAAAHAGRLMGYFYNHLSRLIWADMCGASVDSLAEIQHYADIERRSHYLDGPNDVDLVYANAKLHRREAQLYVDIESVDTGRLRRSAPAAGLGVGFFKPAAVQAAEALLELGACSAAGLQIVSRIWSQEYFAPASTRVEAERLTQEMLAAFIDAGLPLKSATDMHVQALDRFWPMPMYNADFTLLQVDVATLRKEQAAWPPPW